MAGLRCCKSKTAFLLGMLTGKRWAPEELFTSEAGARPEAGHILSTMSLHLQRSSNVARRSCHCSADPSSCLHMLACSPHSSQPVHHEPPPAEKQQCGPQVWHRSRHCRTNPLSCLHMVACPSCISQQSCMQGWPGSACHIILRLSQLAGAQLVSVDGMMCCQEEAHPTILMAACVCAGMRAHGALGLRGG